MLNALRDRGLLKVEAFIYFLESQHIHIDRTLVSHWIAGRSHMPADLLPHLAEFTERPDLVFGPYLKDLHLDVVTLPHVDARADQLTDSMLELSASLGRLQQALIDARVPESPGGPAITTDEQRELKTRVDLLLHQLVQLRASLGDRSYER
jgi:hypothetical protein